MQIDERALNFIQKAKAAGFSQQEVYDELISKGYEIGAPRVEQPTETEKSPYSPMEQVKYTLRAAGEAAPFGMGDLVAGYVGAQARNLADYTHGKDLKTRVKGLGKLAFGIVSPKDFKKERADFIKEQEDFAKHHGGLNFAGEMVGGLLTGGAGAARNVIGKQGIKALMNAGAREGAKFGAAYGAGSALTKDTDKISVPEALKGAGAGLVGGTVMGAALPPVAMVAGKALGAGVKGAKAIGSKIAKILKKDAAEANQALGNAGYLATDLAPENKEFLKLFSENPEGTMAAIKSGDPLIAHANSLQLGKTKGAIVANENAEQAYLAAKRAFDDKKIAKGGKFADMLLGENSGKEAAERIADEAHSKYRPLYEEVMKMGEIDLPQEIISNETILGAIQEAQGRAGYTKLKANNVRVLDKAKRVLQDKYKSLKRAGKEDEAIEYQIAKEELVNFMDKKIPQYAEARKAFMTGKELEDFVAKGQDIKTLSIKDVENLAKSMSAEEKEAFKSGVADVVRSSLDKTQKEGADVIGKAFDLPLRRKLEILDIGSDDLINEIKKEMQTNANFRAVGYGSDTAVNLRNAMKFKGPFSKTASVVEALTSPVRTIKSLAEVADNKLQQLSAEEIARLMFDPKALAEEANKPQHQRKIAEILRKSKQSESGQSISGYLGGKLKEKGGYIANPLDDTQMAYHGSPHRFKEFSLDHIGSGEGAQAHGYGAYVAKRQDVGEGYRRRLVKRDPAPGEVLIYEGKEYAPTDTSTMREALEYLYDGGKGEAKRKLNGLIKELEEYIEIFPEEAKATTERIGKYKELLSTIDKLDINKFDVKKGQLYEVKIPKNDVLLDEDLPLKEQPKSVKKAILAYMKDNPESYIAPKSIDDLGPTEGRHFYNDVALNERRKGAQGDGAKEASQTLNKYGIKGIRYVGTQDGESFVIFDPKKDIKINKTFYSVLAALASAGLLNNGMKQEAK